MVTSRSFGNVSNAPIELLNAAGIEVINKSVGFDQAEFERTIVDYDALVIGAHPFPPEVMERCKKLKIICKHGVGLDNIPLDKAKECGIAVCNAPGTNANAVADLAFGMMLDLARKISLADRKVHQGEWKVVVGVDVCNKVLGLLGFGAIAKNVARRAKGFGMKVLAYDPYVTEVPEEFASFVTLCDCETVIRNADFISLHLPLTDETRNMIAAKELSEMKQGAFLVNTSRGGIVNEQDLYEAVRSGHLGGTAMDVTVVEPMPAENPLRELDNVIITPHIGMYSTEALGAISMLCAQYVVAKLQGGETKFQVV